MTGGQVIIGWSDEDVDDYIFLSGVIGDCSVRNVTRLPDGTGYEAIMDDPDDPDGNVRGYRLTRDDFRRAATEIAEGEHEVDQRIRVGIEQNDLDVNTVNAVIQIAVYGEVHYSS